MQGIFGNGARRSHGICLIKSKLNIFKMEIFWAKVSINKCIKMGIKNSRLSMGERSLISQLVNF